VLDAARSEDWRAVADELIAKAREVNGEVQVFKCARSFFTSRPAAIRPPLTSSAVRRSSASPRISTAEVTIYFEGAIFGQENMRTLADRARNAAGRMVEQYPTTAMRVVPRDASAVVGTFDLREARIMLTGPGSERAVAEWLGVIRLDPAELMPGDTGSARRAVAQAPTDLAVASVYRSVMESPALTAPDNPSHGDKTGVRHEVVEPQEVLGKEHPAIV
jgi:hypothetical protein